MKQKNDFEKTAQRILRYLKSDSQRYDEGFLPRPFFIEFTGSPSSGKTTTITELDKFLRRQGFRVLRPQEGAEVIRHISRKTPLYNIRTGLYALSLLIDIAAGHSYDIVIFDRCVFDVYCWMMYWQEKNLLSDEETCLVQKFFLSRFWMDKIDVAYFMICDPEIAMERELRIGLSQTPGETTNPESLRVLAKRFRTAYRELSPLFPQLTLLDTSQVNETEMVQGITSQILRTLEHKALQRKRKT